MDIALLVALVNDPKYGEACEALYSSNAIVLDYREQLLDLALRNNSPDAFQQLTHLELNNFGKYCGEFLVHQNIQMSVLGLLTLCSRLPKLRSLTIAIDSLCFAYSTFRDQVASSNNARHCELVCTGVGRYRLDCNETFVVNFTHYALVHHWKEAKRERDSFDGVVDWLLKRITVFRPEPDGSLDRTTRLQLDQDIMSEFGSTVNGWLCGETAELFKTVELGTSFRNLDKDVCHAQLLEAISNVLCAQSEYAFPTILKADVRQQLLHDEHLWHYWDPKEQASIKRTLRASYTDMVAIAVGIKYEWPAISKLKVAIEDQAPAEESRAADDTEERAE
ncbi:hypothetical protein LTR56_004947 [Elasticomyces elasticus]|nr:hypothetical protein LTR22_015762 [Elasticomyces elasticus]KAK3652653.1 hypothetical protein LTR56_004947 [Elasticomyces elasticus]KAK4914583.1 hypothetical protein LTR49_017150 [Elasticomyces elasticus]KAK5753949.1 hypothetical protein LTS12_015915 [Elasticomyces elasticus]